MFLDIKAVGARDLPKMDIIGKADPYVKKTFSPIWNEEFQFEVDKDGIVHVELYDWDKVSKDDLISSKDFPISSFQIDKVIDNWYDFNAAPKVPKPGKVHLVFHLSVKGHNSENKYGNVFYKLQPKTFSEEILRGAFDEIDVNQNGSINLTETKDFFEKIGLNHVFAPLAFEICGKDKDSTIKFDEFQPFYLTLSKMNQDPHFVYKILFEKFDVDKSGFLDNNEVTHLLYFFGGDNWNENDARAFLKNYDTNHDGKLDFQELCRMIDNELCEK